MKPGAAPRLLQVSARVILGGVFVYLGAAKALDPVGFLKLARQFAPGLPAFALNATAGVLPWVELVLGAVLIAGYRVRAAALLLLLFLAGFTALVAMHARELYASGVTPFCAIRFDCGCGGGEVAVCPKLLQNFGLLALAVYLTCVPPRVSPTASA